MKRSLLITLLFSCLVWLPVTTLAAPPGPPEAQVTEHILHFTATDGTPLEGKLTLPADTPGLVPVVYHLHGAGPRNYDNAVGQYQDAEGKTHLYFYYDFYSHELARRGIAFFRINKRGCSMEASGKQAVDKNVFSKATPTVLLEDYSKGLEALRERKDIDSTRIVLSGASEGTRLAPLLALRSPGGIVGLILAGYAADNQHDLVVWQNTTGPWRNIQKLIPEAADGTVTQAEYDAAVKRDASLAAKLPLAAVDTDKDGKLTAEEMAKLVRPRLEAILKAVEENNDEFLWLALGNLTTAYLKDGWNGAATHALLLKLNIPLAIFHGELDGTTRVEGAREAQAAFRTAEKANLDLHIYPGHDHDLNWTQQASVQGGPQPFQDMFAFAARLVKK